MGKTWSRLALGWDRALDLLYPTRCLICDGDFGATGSALICPECERSFDPMAGDYCRRCAQPFGPHAIANELCSNCQGREFAFLSAVAYGRYQGRLRDAVHRLKFFGQDLLARPLGDRVAETVQRRIPGVAFDLVVPVPASRVGAWLTPRNPAQLIAEQAARRLGSRLRNDLLRKTRKTMPQSDLDRRGRLENLVGAMQVGWPTEVIGRSVLIVDDILTTGATVAEAARALHAAGARLCHAAVVAR